MKHFIRQMNNKGQSLIAFILLLPVVFVFVTGLWEIGNISYVSSKMDMQTESALKYGLKHLSEEGIKDKIELLLDKNFEGTKEVTIGENDIIIKVNYVYHNLYSKYIKPIIINRTYIGKLENETIIIEKEG